MASPSDENTMNTTNATVLVADISHQVKRANEMGATHLQISTLDVVWLIEMAKRDIARSEHPDNDNLQLLHEMVAQLCVRLGANADEVPCDVWHLDVLIGQLQRSLEDATRQLAPLQSTQITVRP